MGIGWGQQNMTDPGARGMEQHAEQLRREHKGTRNPLKKRRRKNTARSYNFVQKFFRALMGK
ncbi:MAG: hypothetical protein U5Q44_07215 [Dehalococcoidia bacterium]|nr:hypothetical protein [Dehalococcoidia bacterium]